MLNGERSIVFLCNEQPKCEIKETISFAIVSKKNKILWNKLNQGGTRRVH